MAASSLYREIFPFYGCFLKGGMVYWGRGGTEEQIEEQIDYFLCLGKDISKNEPTLMLLLSVSIIL
jgi:hypothetical protein